MDKMTWQNKLMAVAGGLAVVFVLVGATVARANNPNACVDCRNYWGWWAANRTMAQGGCSDHPNVNQSNNKGVCIANVQNAHCAAICAANPPSSPVSSCDGEEGILSACAANAEVACHGLQEAEAARGRAPRGVGTPSAMVGLVPSDAGSNMSIRVADRCRPSAMPTASVNSHLELS
jgi:hypothetical protein